MSRHSSSALRPASRRLPAALAAALLAIAQAASAGTTTATGARVLERRFPVQGLEAVSLVGGHGRATVRVGSSSEVVVQVTVSPRRDFDRAMDRIRSWFFRDRYEDAGALIQALELRGTEDRTELTLRLDPGVRERKELVEETWVVEVPTGIAVDAELDVGDLRVEGVDAGATLSVGVGEIDVDVPRGDLRVDVSVGNAHVRTRSTALKSVVLRASVGDTDLWIDGLAVHHDDPPGPGSRVALDGGQGDTIRVTADVGSCSVRVR